MTWLPQYFKTLSPTAGLALVARSCTSKRAYRSKLVAEWSVSEWAEGRGLTVDPMPHYRPNTDAPFYVGDLYI